MDENGRAIFKKLNTLAPCGTFVIVETDDFFDELPENERTFEAVNNALFALQNEGFIEVKYSRGTTLCLACLKDLPPPKTLENTPQNPAKKPRFYAKIAPFLPFLGALFGSFLGVLVGKTVC